MIDQILNHLKHSKNILLTSHKNPDGDAIGSLSALSLALMALTKKVTVYNESPIPAVYKFLPNVKRFVSKIESAGPYDTAIVLDCGKLMRIGHAEKLVQQIPAIINIDHHVTNTGFGLFHVVDPKACATAEIIYNIVKKLGIRINKAMATSIYTGILTDTGSFRFSNTNRAAFEICQEMVSIGVDPYCVAQHVYGTYSMGRIKLLNLALDSIEISDNNKLSMMTVTQEMLEETNTQPEDIDGIINYAKRIKNIKVAALIHEQKGKKQGKEESDKYHVSLRSDGTVDVAAIAVSFGGGGHFSASGYGSDGPIKNIKNAMYKIAEKL